VLKIAEIRLGTYSKKRVASLWTRSTGGNARGPRAEIIENSSQNTYAEKDRDIGRARNAAHA
jgi:hypothetical protein